MWKRERDMRLALVSLSLVVVGFTIFPIYLVWLMASLSPYELYVVPVPLFPRQVEFNRYFRIFADEYIINGMLNSLIVSLTVVIITMPVATLGGYAMSRLRMRVRNVVVGLLLGSRVIPPVALMVPYYMLFLQINLRGTYLGIIVLHLALTIPLVSWIIMTCFMALPLEVEQAARIDGCSRMQALLRITLPLARPVLAVATIIAFTTSWNEFFLAWLISVGTAVQPLVPRLVTVGGTDLASTLLLMNIFPAIVVAILLQKRVAKVSLVPGLTYMQD